MPLWRRQRSFNPASASLDRLSWTRAKPSWHTAKTLGAAASGFRGLAAHHADPIVNVRADSAILFFSKSGADEAFVRDRNHWNLEYILTSPAVAISTYPPVSGKPSTPSSAVKAASLDQTPNNQAADALTTTSTKTPSSLPYALPQIEVILESAHFGGLLGTQ